MKDLIDDKFLRPCLKVLGSTTGRNWKWIRHLKLFAIGVLLVGLCSSPAWGQLVDLNQIFEQASSVGATRIGNIEVAPVHLDGRDLFRVAAPIANQQETGTHSIDWRVKEIEFRLHIIANNGLIKNEQNLEVTQVKQGDRFIITAYQPGLDGPQQILTVTELDAAIDPTAIQLESVALHRAGVIKQALIEASDERQPKYIREQIINSILALIGMGCTIAVFVALGKFRHRILRERIQETSESEDIPLEESSSENSEELSQEAPIDSDRYSRYKILRLPSIKVNFYAQLDRVFRYFSRVIMLGIFVGGAVWILGRFPQTRPLSNWLFAVPVSLLLIPIAMIGIKGILDWLALYFVNRWLFYVKELYRYDDRTELRAQTFLRVLKDLIANLIWLVGALVFFETLGILPLGLLIFALLGFASQSILKDWLQGAIILLEDHYATGDIIEVWSTIGTVEFMNLRVTQLRTIDGRLVSVGNSKIDLVGNLSSHWSRVDLSVDVAYQTDLDLALEIIREVAHEMQNDEEWQELIIEDPVILGVDNFAASGISIRLLIKTQPGQHFIVAREYRRRLKPAFDRAGITIPFPQQSIWFENPLPERGSAKQETPRN